MAPKAQKPSTSQFFGEDIVRRISQPQEYGMVMRCWHDSEDTPPPVAPADPLLRALERGEIGVQFFPSGTRSIMHESEFVLVDRAFQLGDVCKRSFEDVRSGVVLATEVEAKVEHAINGTMADRWIRRDELTTAANVFAGDFVICDDWIGQIEEIFDEVTVQLSATNKLFRFAELGGRFNVGDKGADLIPYTQSFFGSWFSSNQRAPDDTIVQVRPTVLAVSWLAINQSLDKYQTESRQRPPRFWAREDLDRLVCVRGRGDSILRVGDRVTFRDPSMAAATGITYTRHGQSANPSALLEVNTLIVNETRTTVDVLWQDGTKERLSSKDLIPYLNVDEYDCWPGDYVLWKGEDEKRIAVVQSAQAEQRTAVVQWYGTNTTETVSVLELDPHGSTSGANASPAPETFGVRRGDFVLIHLEGATNGAEFPRVPRIGELEAWVREVPNMRDPSGTGWRGEMAGIGMKVAEDREKGTLLEGEVKRDGGGVTWFGEVTHLRTNGETEITLPGGDTVVLPIERLTILYDGLDGMMEDLWGDEYSDPSVSVHGDDTTMEIEYEDEADAIMSEGSWETDEGEARDDWGHHDTATPTQAMELDKSQIASEPAPMEPPAFSFPTIAELAAASASNHATITPIAVADSQVVEDDSSPWRRFAILEEAPVDHAFYSQPAPQPTKAFMSRLQKEYRVLSSSLPESILVRAYEDRADLLRVLIIGPENTPYQDAPFVIDWMLEGTFPQTPPVAHFLSWTNGNGRVNPNLYEEGKVCLSILGTWAGEKSESWNPARSSLLQAFVSIQGLVLVKDPWFCEPAFDKLRGTEEGIVNSRLYSEKAYVLSRGFVRRALEIPLGSLEAEVAWLYYKQGRLRKVLADARALVEKSRNAKEDAEADRDLAVPRLTAGGVLTLNRTLDKLQALLDKHTEQHEG